MKVLRYEDLEKIPANCELLYELALTNYEVHRMFYDMVRGWFNRARVDYNDFVKALLVGDVEAMNVYMECVAEQIFSSFDSGTKPSKSQPERFYHGFAFKGKEVLIG